MKSMVYMQLATFALISMLAAYHYAMELEGVAGLLLAGLSGIAAAFAVQFTVSAASRRVAEARRNFVR